MIYYNGFNIDSRFKIFKNGKQIFTAWFHDCCNLQEAKDMIDLSNQEKINRLKKINLAVPLNKLTTEYYESAEQDREKEIEKIEQHYLIEHENL